MHATQAQKLPKTLGHGQLDWSADFWGSKWVLQTCKTHCSIKLPLGRFCWDTSSCKKVHFSCTGGNFWTFWGCVAYIAFKTLCCATYMKYYEIMVNKYRKKHCLQSNAGGIFSKNFKANGEVTLLGSFWGCVWKLCWIISGLCGTGIGSCLGFSLVVWRSFAGLCRAVRLPWVSDISNYLEPNLGNLEAFR